MVSLFLFGYEKNYIDIVICRTNAFINFMKT